MKKTIIFDNEGVIVDTEKLWDKGQQKFMEKYGLQYVREELKHLLAGGSALEGMKIIKERYGIEGEVEILSKERLSIVEELIKNQLEFIVGFEDFYFKIFGLFQICVATSMKRELLDHVIENIGLNRFFGDRIYSVDDIGGIGKPNPAIFLHAAEQLLVSPKDCIVIEDTPKGIQAANSAGMFSVGLTTTFERDMLIEADLVCDNYEDLYDKIKNI